MDKVSDVFKKIPTDKVGDVLFLNKKDARAEFVDKNSYRKPFISISSTIDVASRIDLYDHESNAMGCRIFNYDYYERQRKIQILLMIGILGLYFLLGFLLGYSMVYAG